MKRWLFICLACIGLLLIGAAFFVGRWSAHRTSELVPTTNRTASRRLGQEGLINPLLYCETADAGVVDGPSPTRDLLQEVTDRIKKEGRVSRVSVYFRGLNSGRGMGIQENETYSGASLMKLPFFIAYLKSAEHDPSLLGRSVVYDGSFDEDKDQNLAVPRPLEKGKKYTVADLLYNMAAYSGNNATVLLAKQIDLKFVQQVYQDLDVDLEEDIHKEQLISPKEYSYFFRVLYNGSYLSRAMSEQALEVLAESTFQDGLRAGVPKEVSVAHKFGERQVMAANGSVMTAELHDCGIIYHSRHPYFLCVMTEGERLEPLKGVIQEISERVYDLVDHDYTVR